jgi:gliding motility-associated-like protein
LVDSLTLSELVFDIENFNINVITPNADGSNDFLDFSVYDLKQLSFTVFNRWGNQVFNSDDVGLKWDGKTNSNKQLSDGTYFYILNATTSSNKQINKHNYMNLFY